jgi:hypothetical protein
MKNIYILWASIRPKFVLETSKRWIQNCKNKDNLYFKIAMATDEQKLEIENFNIPNCEVVTISDKPGYNYAITQLTKDLEVDDNNILVLLSDDFACLPNWDEYLYRKFEQWDEALFLDDGCQDVHRKQGKLCITLACMTFKCLKKLNKVVFSPNYFHFFSDDEAFHNLNQLGLLKDDRDIDNFIFKHEHHSSGYRERDEFDFRALDNWDHDSTMFNKRIQMSVQERLDTILGSEE